MLGPWRPQVRAPVPPWRCQPDTCPGRRRRPGVRCRAAVPGTVTGATTQRSDGSAPVSTGDRCTRRPHTLAAQSPGDSCLSERVPSISTQGQEALPVEPARPPLCLCAEAGRPPARRARHPGCERGPCGRLRTNEGGPQRGYERQPEDKTAACWGCRDTGAPLRVTHHSGRVTSTSMTVPGSGF